MVKEISNHEITQNHAKVVITRRLAAKFIHPDLRDGHLILKLSETVSVKRLTPYKKKSS